MAIVTVTAGMEIPVRLLFHYRTQGLLLFLSVLYFTVFCINSIQELENKKAKLKTSLVEFSLLTTFHFLTTFPFEMIALFLRDSFPVLSSVLLLFSLTKVLRLLYLVQVWTLLQDMDIVRPSILRLLFSFLWLILIFHWVSLGWLALDKQHSLLLEEDIIDYLWALYWTSTTLTTTGYGDITPDTHSKVQLLYTIFVEISGVGIYGYFIGNLASILANMDIKRTQFKERVEKTMLFLKEHKVPPTLQQRVRNYQNYLWETRKGSDEQEVLAYLPKNLRTEVVLFLNKDIIEKVPLFKNANESLIEEIVLALKPILYQPGDYIFHKGAIGREMYFIAQGSVEVVSQDGNTVYATLGEGNFFGEIALLSNNERNAGVRAKTYCDLYYLEKNTFESIIHHYPEFEEAISKMASQRK